MAHWFFKPIQKNDSNRDPIQGGFFVSEAIRDPAHPQILCGDFNSPKEEHADGTVVAWGPRRPFR